MFLNLAAFDCNFVKFVVPPATESHEQVGLWNYQWWDHHKEEYTCRDYRDISKTEMEPIQIDGYWKAARAFSCITLIIGGFIVCVVGTLQLYRCCFSIPYCKRKYNPASRSRRKVRYCNRITGQVEGSAYVITCIFSTLVLLFLKSNACQDNTIFNLTQDHECKLSTGAYCTYGAMALWLIAAILALVNEERRRRRNDDEGEDTDDTTISDLREPLIQDAIFECEQSVMSSRDGDAA